MGQFADRIGLLGGEQAFELGPFIDMAENAGDVVRCNLGEPDAPLSQHIKDAIIRAIHDGRKGYCDPMGILLLREAIAEDTSKRLGIEITPDRVVVFPGAKPAIFFSVQALCDKGDEVVFASPGYPVNESAVTFCECRPVVLEIGGENEFSITADMLEPLISEHTRLIFLNTPSNPTGGVLTRSHLESMCTVIRRKAPNAMIVADEVYEHILYDGAKHVSIASIAGMASRVIIISSVSKSYAWPGARVGWAICPSKEVARVFRQLVINYYSCVCPYNQYGAVEAIRSPKSGPAIEAMVQEFQRRRDNVVSSLNKIPGISCTNPSGAFYAFPNIGELCDSIGAVTAMHKIPSIITPHTSPSTLFQMFLLFNHGVATMDRPAFCKLGSNGQHFLRISFGTSNARLQEAMVRIAAAAKDKEGFRKFIEAGRHFSYTRPDLLED